MKNAMRLLSLALAAVMLFSLTACSGSAEKWAVDVDGEQIPTGLYLYYQFNAYQEASNLATDTETDVLKQKIEEQDATLWIYSKTIENCKRKVAVEREFTKLGLTLTADQLSYVDSITEYVESLYGTTYEENGISKDTIKSAVTVDQMASVIFTKYYGEGGLEPVAESELKTNFVDNYAIIYAFGTNTTGAAADVVTKTKTAINNALANVKAGKSVSEVSKLFNKELNPDAAESDVVSTDDDYKMTVVKTDDNYPQTLRDAVFKANADEPFLYEEDSYEMVIIRKDVSADAETFAESKATILQTLKGSEFEEKLTALAKDLVTKDNNSAIRYYSAKKIKDFSATT